VWSTRLGRAETCFARYDAQQVADSLDILALEPFYGGVRRAMMEAITRCSRHRWTVLKLPARRIERRLTAASYWFAEQLTRHGMGKIDLLFTSEAINLADLYRLLPQMMKRPSVVYFHSDQLPSPQARNMLPTDLVNLNTAAAATEIWFNSLFHLRSFLSRAGALVQRYPELATRNPMPELTAKAQILYPPLDQGALRQLSGQSIDRVRRSIVTDTVDADMKLLSGAFGVLGRRGETFQLYAIGGGADMPSDIQCTMLSPMDDVGIAKAMMGSSVYLSTRVDAPADHWAVRALLAGCWPLFPQSGVYRELIPEILRSSCLYDGPPDILASRLQDAFHLERIGGYEDALTKILRRFDPLIACTAMDDRLADLAAAKPLGR
jgi:hypothetical protein